MTRNEIFDIRDIAIQQNMDWKNVTGGMNGYPAPFRGYFIYGFENMESAQDFISAHGGELSNATWKQGWTCCQVEGCADREYTADDYLQDLGPDYRLAGSVEDITQEALERIDDILPDTDLQRIKSIIEHTETIIEEIEKAEDAQVITYGGQYHQTIPNKMMDYNEDTTTYAVGVFLRLD